MLRGSDIPWKSIPSSDSSVSAKLVVWCAISEHAKANRHGLLTKSILHGIELQNIGSRVLSDGSRMSIVNKTMTNTKNITDNTMISPIDCPYDYPHRAADQHLSRSSARRFGRGLIDIGLQFTLVLRGLRRDLVRIIKLLVTITAEPIETIILPISSCPDLATHC